MALQAESAHQGTSKPKVAVTRKIPAAGLDRITASCDAFVWPDPMPPPRDALLRAVAGCEGVVTLLTDAVNGEFFDAAGPQLKVVSNFAVGFNNIDVAEATRRGVRIGNTPNVLTDATADMAFALLIAAARRIVESRDYVLAGKWKTWEPEGHVGVDLWERTIGIVGMGRIGMAMARRCRGGWGMRILYHDRFANEQVERELGARRVEMDELLGESDFVSVHTDLNETTRGMFNSGAFAKMKRSAVFINTARGPLHVHADLHAALRDGTIFAAGLDVTDPEPISMSDPLLSLPNCVIAPHIASATVSSRNGMAEIAADNLLLGIQGRSLRCPVNFQA
ncbi:MAG: D-glycerate dehydrogenase [Planctomycetes bacterium]|nr:D-glycerate dehydrogenase [Planctomycetota bacterium]